METIERISLALGAPKQGWLPLRLQLNDFVLEDTVSNVLNGPVSELIEATLSARRRWWAATAFACG